MLRGDRNWLLVVHFVGDRCFLGVVPEKLHWHWACVPYQGMSRWDIDGKFEESLRIFGVDRQHQALYVCQ